jgi:hypothetical protein
MARLRFDTQKVVVQIYALINLAYRQQPQLLKVTTLIASRSLTVTGSQPCKFTLTNQTQDFTKLILGSTNHVRVHAPHDCQHGCHDNFYTLQRLYTFPTSCDYPWQSDTCCTDGIPFHISEVRARKSLQGC